MRLFNDVLRDLGQRHKGSEGSAARVSLTPAPEHYKELRKQPIWSCIARRLWVKWSRFD